ncbi:MAG: hypothetical protein K9N07_07345 [Candidatus Cloacimonetes bacterium]|nr:hypothetical protein [Candidatus Cloacimonadota bacterium]
MSTRPMIKANNELIDKIDKSNSWKHFKKTKPLWAKKLEEDTTVKTQEGEQSYNEGNYLCKGPTDDIWGQEEESLFKKYDITNGINSEGRQKYLPKPDTSDVMAAQIDHESSIDHPEWGTFHGNSGDYLVKSYENNDIEFPMDAGIVKKEIFEGTYEKI